jgi:hypothetical protein
LQDIWARNADADPEESSASSTRPSARFIDPAIGALAHGNGGFDKAKARLAGARIRELRKGGRLDLKGESVRELAHVGHKY